MLAVFVMTPYLRIHRKSKESKKLALANLIFPNSIAGSIGLVRKGTVHNSRFRIFANL